MPKMSIYQGQKTYLSLDSSSEIVKGTGGSWSNH